MRIKNEKFKQIQGRLQDIGGRFRRFIDLKTLEKYSNEIDMVLTLYNKKSCDETMMVKGLRKSSGKTTNRKIHQDDVTNIAKEIAKKLGLNEEIVGIMAKHHDIGHTFLGHSGEWWISSIQEDDGLGVLVHNTLGARELILTEDVCDQIIDKIKIHNPNVKQKELDRVKKSLWLVIDGINSHNGEKPEKEYLPDLKKQETDFEEELLKCYAIKGYDRKIVPATPEACLMRLADQISYIPLDMVDGFREGLVRDEDGNIIETIDEDYIKVLVKMGITRKELDYAVKSNNLERIAERLKEYFINDVIANSTKQKITMSKNAMDIMNQLRNLNNSKAVDHVVLMEDQMTYPPAIRELRDRYAKIYMENMLSDKIKNKPQHVNCEEVDTVFIDKEQQYRKYDEGFIKYILAENEKDITFTEECAKLALKESIGEELDIARECVLHRKAYEDKKELGLDYSNKNRRIRKYIIKYEKELNEGNLIGYNDKRRQMEIEEIYEKIISGKKSWIYLEMEERVAKLMAGKYLASLNDSEFIDLLQNMGMITKEQYESLTRKYRDIKDLTQEAYTQSNWKEIANMQKKITEDPVK